MQKKPDLKRETDFHTSKFAEKPYFASLKSDVDELDIEKLKTVANALNNLKSKVDKLNVNKLKTVHVDLKKVR